LTDTNGPPPTRLELFLHGLRVRITSEPGVLPLVFEVQGLTMREGAFRHFCREAGVNYDDVVRAVWEGKR
jgi:hypothetical protein